MLKERDMELMPGVNIDAPIETAKFMRQNTAVINHPKEYRQLARAIVKIHIYIYIYKLFLVVQL